VRAGARSSHFRVPSAEACSATISGARISAASASFARSAFERSVICAKSSTRRL
jgi:hypothetical protein